METLYKSAPGRRLKDPKVILRAEFPSALPLSGIWGRGGAVGGLVRAPLSRAVQHPSVCFRQYKRLEAVGVWPKIPNGDSGGPARRGGRRTMGMVRTGLSHSNRQDGEHAVSSPASHPDNTQPSDRTPSIPLGFRHTPSP